MKTTRLINDNQNLPAVLPHVGILPGASLRLLPTRGCAAAIPAPRRAAAAPSRGANGAERSELALDGGVAVRHLRRC